MIGESPASTPSVSRDVSPAPPGESSHDKGHKRVDSNSKSKHKHAKGRKRRNAWVFGLGGLFGVLAAGFFAGKNDLMDLAALQSMNLDSIFDVLPAGLLRDAQALQVSKKT